MERRSENRQTISSLASYGHTFAGLCSNGHPARDVKVDIHALIAQIGPDALVRHAMQRITCKVCGKRVPMTIAPIKS